MPKRFHVEVTQQKINESIRRDSSHCMIAEAVREQIPGASLVSVDLQTIRWTDRALGRRYLAFTPTAAQQALVDFDRGTEVKPFAVRLSVVQTIKVRKRSGEGRTAAGETEPKRISNPSDTAVGIAPETRGGKLPPSAALSNRRGRRRTYGLRSLDR